MNCTDVLPQITDYTKAELSPDIAELVAQHLNQCPSCRAIEAETKQGFGLLHSAPAVPAPASDLFNRILAAVDGVPQLQAAAPPPRGGSRWLTAAATAAAVLLVALVVSVLLSQGPAPTRNTVAKLERLGPGVTITITEGESARALKEGDVLREGDRIEMQPGAAAIFSMPGVGRFRVSGGTVLTVTGERALRLDSGEVIADITPNGRGFSVVSPEGETRVLGTLFRVGSSAGRTAVTVARGKVRFGNAAGSVEVPAGSQSVATHGGAPAPPLALEATAADWDLFQSVAPSPIAALAFESGARGDQASFLLTMSSEQVTRLEASVSERTYVVLTVEDSTGQRRLVRLGAGDLEAEAGVHGVVSIDRNRPLLLRGTLTGLTGEGPWTVSAMFASGGRDDSWSGYAESAPVTLRRIR